ncbi:MAG: 4Fe-4S dicluster domain-containing protein [Planctomycetota bacterium]|jgi:2-oxoglutarate ferredoxin oxidoreductase subunit delta
MKKIHFEKHRCKGCGLCVIFCPQKNLRMSEDLNDQGLSYPEEIDPACCNGCGLCFRMCPDTAIEIHPEGVKNSKK